MEKYTLIAATGCPTGIAHTYMAQEALEMAAKKAGISIKVETHGQIGIENELTQNEIDQAEAVIIAADKDVHSERFAGKRIIEVSVSKGIKDADQLVTDALAGKGTLLVSEKKEEYSSSSKGNATSIGHKIYKDLMNGVSHMLPFVIGGGILIAISFLWGIYSFDPKSEQYNQIAASLKSIGDVAFGLMVPVLSGYIAESIAKRPGLVAGFVGGMLAVNGGAGFLGGIISGFAGLYIVLGLGLLFNKLPKMLDGLKAIFLLPVFGVLFTGVVMLILTQPMVAVNEAMTAFISGFQDSSPIVLGIIMGCMCAFDMGGPVNKAAYVASLALMEQGNYYVIAGFSAACIAPPFITGFAVLFFKKFFTTEEYNSGLVNFILGSTHITEGAIPFVASDPLRNMPVMMFGSSIAATLTYLFKVQVPAPHGGFLVLPVVTGAGYWVISILIGSIIAGLLMGFLRKKRELSAAS